MKLMVGWRFPQDAVVQIELEDVLYLGEICYCRPEPGGFVMGIEIDHVITGLRDLAKLRRRIAAGSSPERLAEYTNTASRDDQYRQLLHLNRSGV